MDSGASITAVLRLNTAEFSADITKARETLTTFRNSMSRMGENSAKIKGGLDTLAQGLSNLIPLVSKFSSLVTQTASFNKFALGLKNMSIAVQNLSNVTNTSQVGMIRIKEIMNAWSEAARGLTVNLRTLKTEESAEVQKQRQLQTMYREARNDLLRMGDAVNRWNSDVIRMNEAETQSRYYTQMLRKEWGLSGNTLVEVRGKLMQLEGAMVNFNKATVLTSADLKKMEVAEKELSASTTQATSQMQRQASATNRASSSMSRATTQTSRLGKALSSLRMMGTMVGSMLAYNFAHHLAQATNETIQSKSEMEGYFKMLHYGQNDINRFNSALDKTVQRFQRVNKYSLGETISSIGVEFNLTTDEMIKAMDVTSMITSEYLRAGRNANEASLAVKDVLQGQFQRLSRETGVKGEQLKEAGWNGDVTDVNSLLDALRKVGEDRNWDVFAEKANSLNDIVTILQNRFGEWSADMVNVVQPSIVGAFNSIMSFAQGLSQSLGGVWQWLSGDSWGAVAVKIGGIATAILSVAQAFTMYRTGMSMVQIANMGLTKTIASLVLGLKGQEIAEVGVRNAIMSKILGVKAETIAETSVANAIVERTGLTKMQTLEEKLNTLSSEENTVAKKYLALQEKVNKAELEGLIAVEEADTLRKELNTAMTEANALASLKQAGVNGGLTATFIALGGAENVAAVATGEVSVAMGILNGIFYASPIGWITLAILGLASAFYVLSGGLDESWAKMKEFNSIMQDTGSAQKEANQWLEQVKQDAGENSQAFKDASDSVEDYTHKLQSASYWYQHSQTAFEGSGLTMETSSKDILKDYGISKEEAEEWNGNLDLLNFGKDKYYKAEQVLNKQIKGENSNYGKDLDEYLEKVKKSGGDLEEAYDKMTGNYKNLAEHSYIANTSDDWWEWGWNSLYAGMDQFWIDWDNFWADPQWGDAIDGVMKGLDMRFHVSDILKELGIDGMSGDEIVKAWDDFWKGVTDGIGDWQKGAVDFLKPLDNFGDEVNKFLADPIGYLGLGQVDVWGTLMDWIFPSTVSASDGSSDHPTFMQDLSAILGFDVQSWIDSFTSDPLGTLGIDLGGYDILGGLMSVLFGGIDFNAVLEWVNVSLISPISQALFQFMLDPVGAIGNLGFSINGLLDSLFGTDIFTTTWNWTFTNIISPIGNALYQGILQIPIVGDIIMLLGFLSDENIGAEQKGRMIANWIGTGITNMIGQIPIVGDILRMLGLIPQTEGTAKSNGHGVGKSVDDGVRNGMGNMGQWVLQEFTDIANGIAEKGGELYNSAKQVGQDIWNGINSVLQRHSPGFIHDEVMAEFGTDIPNAIQSSGATAYSTAQYYAQSMYDGMNSVQNDGFGLGGVVDEYQTDAQMVATSSQMMGSQTTTAFNQMQTQVNQTTTQMQGNVATSYSSMQQKQTNALNSMKNQNLQAYNDMYLKSNQSLIQMRDSTSNITTQMTHAWVHMKDQIVASANKLKSESTSHFSQLSSTIGSFYRKIQNPSNWGAGSPNYPSRARKPSVGRSAVRTIRGSRGAGINPYLNPNKEVSLRDLIGMVNSSEKVQLDEFLALFDGGFGWNNWSPSHYSYIKSQSDNWNMKAPMILGKYQAGSGFRVGDFEGGKPTIGFNDYVSTAEAIFGSIPYAFYYNSEKWGSWDNAIKHGEANCSDGADALIALAHTMNPNWSTEKVHTTLKGGVGHYYAVINGKVMDTTAFQNRGSWGHLGAGIPTRRYGSSGSGLPQGGNKTVNVTVDMSNSTIYGVEDLDDRIKNGVKEGLREEFNDPFSVSI